MTCPPNNSVFGEDEGESQATVGTTGMDAIDMDSLESYAEDNVQQEESHKEEPHLVAESHLNLNGICKMDAETIEDLVLPDNSLKTLADLQKLSLRSNELQTFPASILELTSLISLDLSNNNLLTIPPEISRLTNLRELILDQNCISVLPRSLWDVQHLRTLRVADNRLVKFVDMRAFVLTDAEKTSEYGGANKTNVLTNLNLRANRLKGNIILGNYGNLTELDVSENSIESLDLVAVGQLQVLQCSRNTLTHLKIHGKNLESLIAGNNRLTKLTVQHPPTQLRHMDVSFNDLDELPEWLSCCHELRSLFASNNNLKLLPDHLFCNEMPYLHTLQLAYNQLLSLPSIQRRLPLQELFLQNNSLSMLPDNFFKSIYNIRVLNLSNNRLCELPVPEENLHLEKLYLTANCLTNKSMERLAGHLKCLRVFHAAYNNFTLLPEDCAASWPDMEEIVLSGNKLLRLPDSIGRLKHLAVLRVHSNLLQSCPKLSFLSSLRVLDLAHNQLDRIDLSSLVPSNLKFLDLSCNTKLHVDSQQFHNYRSQRPMSLVDVSGKNRTSLPLTPNPFCENDLTESSWSVGFSETAGCKPRLYISQIRLPAFCNTEAMFALFDGENSNDLPGPVDKVVPRILLEERTVKETAAEYMKYTMLSAHRELKDKGQKHGISAIIIHILKSKVATELSFCGSAKKYVMRIASVGDVRAVLGRATGPVRVVPIQPRKQLRTNPQLQLMVPDPEVVDILLDEHDEYLIIANKNLWDVITPDAAVKEVNAQRNVILAAKRLQDLAQSYGAEDNLSVIVVRFNIVGSDVDLLMRELRQTIRKNKYQSESGISSTTTCQPGCCCEAITMSCSHCLDKLPPPMLHNNNNDDRSSPSGQSDQACSDCNSSTKLFIQHLSKNNEINRSLRSTTSHTYESTDGGKSSSERRSYRGVAKAVRARREDEKLREDTDSALSEEQFKCWEYMLEQNTQLLFDKELNTLNKANGNRSQFVVKNATLSRSSPHLADNSANPLPSVPFLTRQFGSTRSFNPLMTRPISRYTTDSKKQVMGGPHAAYFGSLQRLMPYNLEYDFAVMQERGLADSLDLDRMQQYWGVTTTEL